MKVLVEKEFEHDGRKYEPGEIVELPENVVSGAIEEGVVRKAEEIEGEIDIEQGDEVVLGEGKEEVSGTEAEGGETFEGKEPFPEEEEITEGEGLPEEGTVPGERKRGEAAEPDAWDELERELDEGPSRSPTWEPKEPGDQLIGEIVRTGRGPNGRLLEVRTPEGENYVLWERVALKDLFDRVNAGDKVGVRFTGERESASGRLYYNFRTAVRRKERKR